MIRRHVRWGRAVLSLVVISVIWVSDASIPVAVAADSQRPRVSSAYPVGKIQVPVNKSRVLYVGQPVTQVSVGNPEIADILVIEADQLYVVGKSIGLTNVVIWGDGQKVIKGLEVEVTHDLETLKRILHEVMPNEAVSVRSVQGNIVLGGQIGSPASVQAAVDLAQGFLPAAAEGSAAGKVINMLQVGGSQQVMLKVQVAEISRSFTKKLNINFTAFGPSGGWRIGAVNGGAQMPDAVIDVPRFDPNTGEFQDFVSRRVPLFGGETQGPYISDFNANNMSIEDKGLYLSYLGSDFLFRMVLEAAKNKGLAKILAEPTLTVMSGQEADFLSGGEFPIPVSKGANEGISVDYKDYGVGLRFLPVVLGSGRISLKVNVSVSELTGENATAIGVPTTASAYYIPALRKRSAVSTVELGDGQTMGIAGMINESLREQVNRFPGLADLPIIGPLFRSQDFEKGQTELVIFVTPYFARGTQRENLTMPTDAFVEPSDAEFYLFGRTIGDPALQRRLRGGFLGGGGSSAPASGGTEGPFGHGL